eukprot:g5070.t1
MEVPRMPRLPLLGKRATNGANGANGANGGVGNGSVIAPQRPTFQLSQLDLGSISVSGTNTTRLGGRKRAATSAPLDDDDDPIEETQLLQLLQQMQKLKQSKEHKRRKAAIAAKANKVDVAVRRHAARHVQEAKSSQDQRAAEIRSAMDSLRKALEEEARLAFVLREERTRAMKQAIDTLKERYAEVANVHAEVQVLRDCMREHFPVVRSHVEAEVEKKIVETGDVVRAIEDEPNRKLSFIKSVGGLAA